MACFKNGIEIASNGDVWCGNGGGDSHVLVFTKDVREIQMIATVRNILVVLLK